MLDLPSIGSAGARVATAPKPSQEDAALRRPHDRRWISRRSDGSRSLRSPGLAGVPGMRLTLIKDEPDPPLR